MGDGKVPPRAHQEKWYSCKCMPTNLQSLFTKAADNLVLQGMLYTLITAEHIEVHLKIVQVPYPKPKSHIHRSSDTIASAGID